jgi:hypothetical protein
MRKLSLALGLAVSAIALAPFAASAAQQTTSTQSSFKSSVKAHPMTHKRRQIIRSESAPHETTGAAPRYMHR